MPTEKIDILMTGGGAPGAAGILHCLKQEPSFRITVADADPEAIGKHLHDDFVTIPMANDPSFKMALFELCREKKIDVILPLVTRELPHLAEASGMLGSEGIKVCVSPAPNLEVAINKSNLYQFLQWRGVTVPDFRVVETVEQFKTAIGELGYPSRAVCFKPSLSNGSRGFRILSEQINELDLLFNHKPSATYISLQDALRILSSGTCPELLVAEYITGDEYSVDCLARTGVPVLTVPRLRKKMINGISVQGEFVRDQNIIAYCEKIITELNLHGNIGIQVRCSNSGQPLVLEINPRVQGTTVAALGAGVNLPVLAVKQELGLSITEADLQVKWGTRFSRYWTETFY
jgi:carbamoyl-phosphate synthase large subunit